jgi:hypothetical protein
MEWIREKSLRNKKLDEFIRYCMSRTPRRGRTACIICPPPSYPRRPTSKHQFKFIGGFNQHPNSTQAM